MHQPEGQQASMEETEAPADAQDDMGPAPMQLAAPAVKVGSCVATTLFCSLDVG